MASHNEDIISDEEAENVISHLENYGHHREPEMEERDEYEVLDVKSDPYNNEYLIEYRGESIRHSNRSPHNNFAEVMKDISENGKDLDSAIQENYNLGSNNGKNHLKAIELEALVDEDELLYDEIRDDVAKLAKEIHPDR